jgi:hypothetical protein
MIKDIIEEFSPETLAVLVNAHLWGAQVLFTGMANRP